MRTCKGVAMVAAGCLVLMILHAARAQEEKVDRPKEKVKVTSLTLFPVLLGDDAHKMIAEALGLILDKEGFKKIELAGTAFRPAKDADLRKMAADFGAFVKKNPIKTDFAMYGEILASKEEGFTGVRGVIVDRAGKVAWTDSQTSEDPEFKRMKPDCPMSCCVLLAKRLQPVLVTAGPAERDEPGPLARLWANRSGLPDEKEWNAMDGRLEVLKKIGSEARVMVFPLRIRDKVNREGAEQLVALINGRKLFKAKVAEAEPWFEIKRSPNEQRTLWGMAGAFKTYLQRNAPAEGYALYADYLMNPETGSVGAVHLALCDRNGDWVIVDFQNSHHEDFKSVSPKSLADCNRLAAKRLEGYLK